MRKTFILGIMLATFVGAFAQSVPTTYYSSIDNKTKEGLKIALGKILKNHTKRTYDNLKTDYKSVYVVTGTKEQVYDLYSDRKYNYSSGGWNREHTVANSWWGGTKNEAYSDLFSVIPSDIDANSRKSNYPPAELTNNVKYDSGRIKVGSPKSGMGGGFSNAWEPYDEFKGDFARILFYVATCYDDIAWGQSSSSGCIKKESWPTLQPWLYKMLLKWHNADPVCDKEIEINEAVYKIQKNRNPFVDYPILADYIWGDLTTSTFDLDAAVPHQHYNGQTPTTNFEVTPASIDFGIMETGEQQVATITVTPKTPSADISLATTIGELSDDVILRSTTEPVDILLTFSATKAGTYSGKVTISDGKSTKIVNVSAEVEDGGSPAVGLTGTFAKVTEEPDDWSGFYLIVYENEKASLALDGSLTDFDGAGKSVEVTIADGKIESTKDCKYIEHAFEIIPSGGGYCFRSYSGYYLGTSDHKKLDESKTTQFVHDISLAADGSAEITYDSKYILRYNASAKMFRYYASGQMPVYLYKAIPLVDNVEEVADIVRHDDRIYNLAGQRVDDDYVGIVIHNGRKYFKKQ